MPGSKAYRSHQVQTSSPLELVLLSYEVLFSALHRAKKAQEDHDFKAEAQHAQQAVEATVELMNGLDYERGGDIATNLASLYTYTIQRVLDAQRENDAAIYDHLIHIVGELRSGWIELRNRQHAQPQQPSAPQVSSPQGAGQHQGIAMAV